MSGGVLNVRQSHKTTKRLIQRKLLQLTRSIVTEGDDLPESAFMYVGTLDDARAKAEKAAAKA